MRIGLWRTAFNVISFSSGEIYHDWIKNKWRVFSGEVGKKSNKLKVAWEIDFAPKATDKMANWRAKVPSHSIEICQGRWVISNNFEQQQGWRSGGWLVESAKLVGRRADLRESGYGGETFCPTAVSKIDCVSTTRERKSAGTFSNLWGSRLR